MRLKKLSRYSALTAMALSLALVLFTGACKKFGIPDYTLKITVEDSIQGLPAAGEYVHPDLTVIEYNYESEDPNLAVEVMFNGSRWAPTGTITMFNNFEMEVRHVNILGEWKFTLVDSSDNAVTQEFVVTFDGDYESGNFTDDKGKSGTWFQEEKILFMTYSDWEVYLLAGNPVTMAGSYSNGALAGSWSAARL